VGVGIEIKLEKKSNIIQSIHVKFLLICFNEVNYFNFMQQSE